ncbi:hypothetical protein [Nannocystis pusilla]|uniref:hypothetical protein n=1 Tax=Nannocystis pusilla TaxID=889268 RepID=UPI003BF0A589
MKPSRRRSWYVVAGVLAAALWLICSAATVIPGSPAESLQWVLEYVLAVLAGAGFGAAAVARSS